MAATAVVADAIADSMQRTCRGAAALRALELLHVERPVIRDPLAKLLAGAYMMDMLQGLWSSWEAAEGKGRSSYFAGRARLLDDRVEDLVGKLLSQHAAAGSAGGGGTVQVVSLGCGVDTRPWRLDFPPGAVAWFDVDQGPVLELKRRLLEEAGAELGAHVARPQAAGGGQASSNGEAAAAAATQLGEAFPLKCASYRQLVANLEEPGLGSTLAAAGFDQRLPTIWIAEGLLYYMSREGGEQLAASMRSCSPAGSRLLATHIPEESLAANRTCPMTGVSSTVARLFTTFVDDLVASGVLARAGWGQVARSRDIGVEVEAAYGAPCYYPYPLEYSGGQPLGEIEYLVEASAAE